MKITTNNIYLTKKGFKDLKREIDRLKRYKQALQKELRELNRQDDKELSYLKDDKLAQIANVEFEIKEKRFFQKQAKLLPSVRNPFEVAVGSIVELIDKTTGRILRYQIVDKLEANPFLGKISIDSPLGFELLGKRVKDVVKFSVGLHTKTLELIRIA